MGLVLKSCRMINEWGSSRGANRGWRGKRCLSGDLTQVFSAAQLFALRVVQIPSSSACLKCLPLISVTMWLQWTPFCLLRKSLLEVFSSDPSLLHLGSDAAPHSCVSPWNALLPFCCSLLLALFGMLMCIYLSTILEHPHTCFQMNHCLAGYIFLLSAWMDGFW